METSIRFVRIGENPIKPALCFRGQARCYIVLSSENGVRAITNFPLRDHDRSAPVLFQHGPYPISKVVEHFQSVGLKKGITARARFLLKRALDGGISEEDPLPADTPDTGFGAREEEQKRSPGSPSPGKPPSKSLRSNSGPSRTAGADVIRRIAVELKLEPTKLRKLLRSKGLRAPYTDEEKVRSALK